MALDLKNAENAGNEELQVSDKEDFSTTIGEEIGRVLHALKQLPLKIEHDLESARIAGKYRAQLFAVIEAHVEEMSKILTDVKAAMHEYKTFGNELFRVLCGKGIESLEDFEEFLVVTERDSELVLDICDMFQTSAGEVRSALGQLQKLRISPQSVPRPRKQQDEEEEKMDTSSQAGNAGLQEYNDRLHDNRSIEGFQDSTNNRCQADRTGARCVQSSRPHLEELERRRPTESGWDSLHLMAMMQANACVNPGVFKGGRSENFNEFIRRFERKYRVVVFNDRTLIDILGDDHLEGRAKSVFHALPKGIIDQGFDRIVGELRRLLASDSTAGRFRALAELRSLRRRSGQSVSEFCVMLEKLGRQANPDCTLRDRSMEYAQILLDNLSDWPEPTQMLGTLHKVDPMEAYETERIGIEYRTVQGNMG
ncbi:unnamed protein product [Nippostrongylus brasiliensis]|uniref:Retrotransposon gag domain-containing protein n=1 Tax=Nippostrongylus brasiliensis TaxID=27835 RepID=A0A0N4Y4A8_NIPBR|nr:unnamed protein product [Nippostrongylus brasiliensis]